MLAACSLSLCRRRGLAGTAAPVLFVDRPRAGRRSAARQHLLAHPEGRRAGERSRRRWRPLHLPRQEPGLSPRLLLLRCCPPLDSRLRDQASDLHLLVIPRSFVRDASLLRGEQGAALVRRMEAKARGRERDAVDLGRISDLGEIADGSRTDLGRISAMPRLTSAVPRLHLGRTSAVPRLYLGRTSARRGPSSSRRSAHPSTPRRANSSQRHDATASSHLHSDSL